MTENKNKENNTLFYIILGFVSIFVMHDIYAKRRKKRMQHLASNWNKRYKKEYEKDGFEMDIQERQKDWNNITGDFQNALNKINTNEF